MIYVILSTATFRHQTSPIAPWGPVLPTNLPTNHLPRYLLVLDPATNPPTTSGTPTQRCSSLLSEDPNSTYLSNILNLLMLCNISVVEMKYWASFSQVEDNWGITPGQFYDFRISANILLLVHLEKIERSGLGGSRLYCHCPTCFSAIRHSWFKIQLRQKEWYVLYNLFEYVLDVFLTTSVGILSFIPGNIFKSLSFIVAGST